MSIITCLKELEERKKLELGDIIEFTIEKQIIKYEVKCTYLQNIKSETTDYNDEVFRILEINNKREMAKKAYNDKNFHVNIIYDSHWPETKIDNFPALTRLVKELYLIIREREPIFTKFTRFEIMEI